MINKKYFKEQWMLFKDSFTLKKAHLWSFLVEIGFLVLFILSQVGLGNFILQKESELSELGILDLLAGGMLDMNNFQNSLVNIQNSGLMESMISAKGIMISLVIVGILFLITTIIIYTLSRSIIWQFAVGEKKKPKTFWKYLLIQIFMIITSLGIIALIFKIFKLNVAQYLIPIIMIYYLLVGVTANSFFEKSKKYWKSIKVGFLNILKIKNFIIPLGFTLIVLLIIVLLSMILMNVHLLFSLLIALLLLFYIIWSKFYLVSVVKSKDFYKND